MADRQLKVTVVGDTRSLERSLGRASAASKGFEKNMGRSVRGAAAGSGVFRSLGRSIAFASGGFLAFATAGQFLRTSIDAAKDAEVAQRQLGVQLANNGKSFAQYRAQIEATDSRLSALSGFTKTDFEQSLTTILRTVPDVTKALRDNALAADLARARHIKLNQAALVIAKTEAGNTSLLRRQGFQIAKTATAEQALAKVRQVVAGQAVAGTTAQERFGATLHNTEVIIGDALLPTLNQFLTSGSKWLQQMNDSGKLQQDVTRAAADMKTVFGDLRGVIHGVDSVTGSFENTLKILLGLGVASKVVGMAKAFGLLAGAEGAASGAGIFGAAGAAGLLLGRLRSLAALGAVSVTLDVAAVGAGLAVLKLLGKVAGGGFGANPSSKKVSDVPGFADYLRSRGLHPDGSKIVAGSQSLDSTRKDLLTLNQRNAAQQAQTDASTSIPSSVSGRGGRLPVAKSGAGLPFREFQLAMAEATRTRKDDEQVLRVIVAALSERMGRAKTLAAKTEIQNSINQYQGQLSGLLGQDAQALKDAASAAKAAKQKIVDARKKALQAFKAQADAIKTAVLDALSTKETKINNARALSDAKAAMVVARRLGGPEGIKLARRDLVDAQLAVERQKAEQFKYTVKGGPGGPTLSAGGIVINIHGITDPDKVAQRVIAELNRRGRHTSPSSRGRTPGHTGI